jgi:hypothetical protein
MGKILRQTTVVRDGWHNGFTDLVYWKGAYWVSYRRGTAHASQDGEAVLAVSLDRQRFRETAHLKVPGDNRDPKLVPMGDRLGMIFPSWHEKYEGGCLQQYVAFSDEGFTWSQPVPILDRGDWLWRVREHNGLYYGLIEQIRTGLTPPYQLKLVTSKDLLHWTPLCTVGPDLPLNESDILFRPDGEAWIVARGAGNPDYSWFASARAPYTDWTLTNLGVVIHCPAILAVKDSVFVTGRRKPDLEGETTFYAGTGSLGVWELGRGTVKPVLHIPASGDCAYPGLIEDPEGRICLSYYSAHAYNMGVLDAVFRYIPSDPWTKADRLMPSDVYFAELSLP